MEDFGRSIFPTGRFPLVKRQKGNNRVKEERVYLQQEAFPSDGTSFIGTGKLKGRIFPGVYGVTRS